MNHGYTQANKRKDMAAKMPMGLKMNGDTTGYGGGIKFSGKGKNSGPGGGMKPTEAAKGTETAGKGMKYKQSNKKANFNTTNIYTQASKGKNMEC